MLGKIFAGTLDAVDFVAWYTGRVVRSFELGLHNQLPEFRTETMKAAVNEVREEREAAKKTKPHGAIGFI